MTNHESEEKATHGNVAEAKARFSELVRRAMSGKEVIIAKDNHPVLRLVPVREQRRPRQPGSARGQIWIAPDFDDVVEDFAEYV